LQFVIQHNTVSPESLSREVRAARERSDMLLLHSGYRYRSSGLRPNSSRHRLRFTLSETLHVAETLLIAAGGAIAFQMVGFPGGLVAGAMLAVAVAALLGRPVKLPIALARVCFVLVGTLLGAVVTPQTLRGIADWPLSVALLVVSSLVMFAATASYLRWVHRWDEHSALLGASPGSMAQVMALAAELGADMRGVAIVQVMRVL
jgi:membrane AbrB-like protein